MSNEAFWQAIVEHDYAVPDGYTLEQLTPELIELLASPDMRLRDGFGYTILAHWIYRQWYEADYMRQMIAHLASDLRKGIGSEHDDTVFRRSFAAVLLASLMNQDNKREYLEADEVIAMLDKALAYLHDEQDLRGYIPKKGWAHSCAHTADLLFVLARNRHLAEAHLKRILDGIVDKFTQQSGYLYVHGEDQRMGRAVLAVFQRDLIAGTDILAFVEKLTAVTELHDDSGGFDPKIHSAYWNTKNLLRAAYFEAMNAEEEPMYNQMIVGEIAESMKKFQQ